MSDDNSVKSFKVINISDQSGRILENIVEGWFQDGDGRYEVVMGKTQNYRALCLIETCNEFSDKIASLESQLDNKETEITQLKKENEALKEELAKEVEAINHAQAQANQTYGMLPNEAAQFRMRKVMSILEERQRERKEGER